ncbi:MAG: GTP 3',8-cyclase MoaA [Clostridia bacterium]|nr:GTP 3',8-cyclase MoaA [Clostridia bacterium]
MKDSFSRDINYMRISVTDRCNLRCKYCMPEEGIEKLGHDDILSFNSIKRIVEAATGLGITKYRITGGEPLVRKGIVNLVEDLAKIDGLQELAMTTNGIMLFKHAEALKEAGLDRVNISIDSLKHDKYKEITRGGNLDDVFEGIKVALKVGLTPVKLNVVVIKDFNDDEILDFAQLSISYPLDIRFIELMPIGSISKAQKSRYLSNDEIKKALTGLIPLEKQDGVADLYHFPNAKGRVGFISPMSHKFCSSCNKIRLTADGKIKPCLHTNQEIDLNQVLKTNDDELLMETIKAAIYDKTEKHHLNDGKRSVNRGMNQIGG